LLHPNTHLKKFYDPDKFMLQIGIEVTTKIGLTHI